MNKTRTIPPLRFLRRFQNGTLGVLVISLNPETGAMNQAELTWHGPQPPLRGENLEWVKQCYAAWSNRFKRKARFLAIFKGGACELWECSPGIPPKCMCHTEEDKPQIDVALQFATRLLSEAPGNPIGGPDE